MTTPTPETDAAVNAGGIQVLNVAEVARAQTHQEDPPNAVFPPFQRGRTGIKGRTKYIQMETGSWVTFNEDGSCHIGARHKYLGNLLEVAGELEQRKEYADAWRINMQRAERERDQLRAEVEAIEQWKKQHGDPAKDIAVLRAQLAAAQEDSKRLDWLDLHISTQETSEILGLDYSKCHLIRAAIDAAKGGAK